MTAQEPGPWPDRGHGGKAIGAQVRRSDRFVGYSAAGLAGLVLGGVAFALLVALVQLETAVVDLDRGIAGELNEAVSGRPLVLGALRVVTDLGGTPASWVVLTTLTVALLVRRQGRLAVYVAVTGLGALVLSPAVKELVGRLRPVVEVPVHTAPGPSFPSGHALGSIVTYGVVLLVFLPAIPSRWRWPAIAATTALVALIGFSRLALGVHFLTDVLGGWLLGLGWLAITTTAFRAWRRVERRPNPPARHGLEPEAAPALTPAPDHQRALTHPVRRGAGVAVAWVLLWGLLIGAGWLVTEVLPGTAIARLDTAVVQWFAERRTPTWTAAADMIGRLGGTRVVVVLAVVAAALLLAVTRRWRPVLFLAVVLVGEVTLFLATASVIDRLRPPVPHVGPDLPPTSSFPSGHVSAAISLYGGLALLVLNRTRRWWGWLLLAAAALVAVLVALARLYFGVHYPTDLLGSALLAVPWLLTCRYLLLRPRPDPQGHPLDQEEEDARSVRPRRRSRGARHSAHRMRRRRRPGDRRVGR